METQRINRRARIIAWLCTAVYFASYVTRINFTVMLVKICSDMGVEKSVLSVVVVGLTVAYGIGQVVSGIVGDHIPPTIMLSAGLSLAIASNIAVSFCTQIPVMAAIWAVNGVAHSMLWPPMVRLLSATLDDREYEYATVRVSWGAQFATILLYLAIPALLPYVSWQMIIRGCAVVGAVILAGWIAASRTVFRNADFRKKTAAQDAAKTERAGKVPFPPTLFLPLILSMLGIVLQGILRDGVSNWTPSFLLETFHWTEERSILATVLLSVFALISLWLFGKIRSKFFRDELVCAGTIFLAGTLAAAVLFFLSGSSAAVTLILLAVLTGCMHGVNMMQTCLLPKRFEKFGHVSAISGILNACTYVGSAIATYGFAVLAENKGWNFTVGSWIVVAGAGALICFASAAVWTRIRKTPDPAGNAEEN